MNWKPAQEPSRFPKWVPQVIRGPLRWCIKWGLVGLALMMAICLFYFCLSQKYDLAEIAKMPERSVILDRNGEEFAFIHGERRRLITREEIPEVMVQALRAREDLHFPDHHGIDLKGLVRATFRNIKDMSFTQGASTLTMQLTRNSYDMRAKSLHRKMLEMAVTLRIEGRYDKDQILTHYLNRIYFGAGCHGVEEAAQTYFGRSVTELNTGECAMLVGIIRGPHLFSPSRNMEGALVQRDEVLSRMVQCDFLSEGKRDAAKNDPIRLVAKDKRYVQSSYMRESIRRQLDIILVKNDIREGGLSIHTTLDIGMQKTCDQLLGKPFRGIENAKEVSDLQAAIVRMDPQTGGILALCGGRSFRESSYNRAFHLKRDLGPAFAPFLHALALERGKVALLRRPLQTGRQLGIEETIRLCKRLGFTGPFLKTEDLYRGSMATNPIELSLATSVLVNKGRRPDPYVIKKITDIQGRVLYAYTPETTQAIIADAAKETLAEVDELLGDGLVSTTATCRDVWATRLESSCVTVLWLGYDKPRKIGESGKMRLAVQDILLGFKK